ncbi:DUF3631 domain-containing protein [Cryptosporangium arvum]|uniref:DUF3631 domain-containing protein n=1 Tax=Cryptosporangium arvum DSM 44712 TaxID=927661 RepID=A0A010ZPM3_9ACTN|nr:DUF3631 domain-containing protein [Cryptosporangium arvum]EXG79172.1 Protein of unknown function (DUF3631) [Cryptosporangium arvum DSM 44712]
MTASGPRLTGAQLLDAIREALTRYVVLPSTEATDAVVLWIAATHAQPAWAHAPRLVIRAPEKRCGKSRLLDVVEATAHDPLITVNATPAAVYRSITSDPPTLLVDEADTIFGPKADGNEDLRGLLNAGHQRNRPAVRYDATAGRVEHIPTFAMAALAGIGAMPDTIEDRAVVVRMRRRGPGEAVAPYRHRRDRPAFRLLAAQLDEWLRSQMTELQEAEPPMPVEDRAADTWEPLVIVADMAGGDWPGRARQAVVALTAEADEKAGVSTRIRLLTDVRAAFTLLGDPPAAMTSDLLQALNSDPEAPWATFGPTGLTGKRLGDLLREFDISSDTIRFPVGQAKGYRRARFIDAWNRYCPLPEMPPADGAEDAGPGVPVPAVPPSFPQVIPGTGTTPVTDRSVTGDLPVPPLSSGNDLGTAGTGTPRAAGTGGAE